MKSWWKSNTAITQISPIDVSVDIVRAVKKTVKMASTDKKGGINKYDEISRP